MVSKRGDGTRLMTGKGSLMPSMLVKPRMPVDWKYSMTKFPSSGRSMEAEKLILTVRAAVCGFSPAVSVYS